jgi:hypothetical protein
MPVAWSPFGNGIHLCRIRDVGSLCVRYGDRTWQPTDAPMSKGVDAHTGNVDVRIEYASYDMLAAGHRLEWKSLRCLSLSSCCTWRSLR